MNRKFIRIPLLLITLVFVLFTAVGCTKTKEVAKVQLNSNSISLSVGETYQLQSEQSDTQDPATIIWVPKNPEIATIDTTGLITAVSAGQATMQAFFSNSSVENAVECVVTVEAENVEGILINESNLTLKAGDSSSLLATVIPESASNKNVFWTSSDEAIVSVDQSGNITALSGGEATINVVTEVDGFSASCVVIVEQNISALTLNRKSAGLGIGGSVQLKATITPETTSSSVTFSSSNEKVATVSDDGTVTAKAVGSAVITATATGGVTATCNISVGTFTKEVALDRTELTLNVGQTSPLVASVKPDNATNKNVKFSSSNAKIAKVDAKGVVTGVAAGSATITVSTVDSGKKATCKVTIGGNASTVPTQVLIEPSSIKIGIGEFVSPKLTVLPETASNKSVTWSSSNAGIAKVENDGRILGVANGTVTITATSVLGNIVGKCEVNVGTATANGINLNQSTLSLNQGSSYLLTASASNPTTQLGQLIWSTNNSNVATVDSSGRVVGLTNGTATIIVQSPSTGLNARCEVTVGGGTNNNGITLNQSTLSLNQGSSYLLTANASNPSTQLGQLIWSTSNSNIATVDSSGRVVGVLNGTATIIVQSPSTGLNARCEVTVGGTSSGINLTQTSLSLISGSSIVIGATPANSSVQLGQLTWISSNANVATVDYSGKVTALSNGSTTITVTSYSTGLSAKCEVTVGGGGSGSNIINLNQTTLSLNSGYSFTLVATPVNSSTQLGQLIWTSTNTNIAVVDSYGRVTGLNTGSAIIQVASAATGATAKCTVNVNGSNGGITLNQASASTNIGSTILLTATSANGSSLGTVTWSTSNPNIVVVDPSGRVTGVNNGSATITAYSSATGTSAKCEISVGSGSNASAQLVSITLNHSMANVSVNSNFYLSVNANPVGATLGNITWTSSNPSVLKVENGTVTTLATGTGMITATVTSSSGQTFSASCTFIVL